MEQTLRSIASWDILAQQQMELLLHQQGIGRDKNLDYSCGIFDAQENLIATGSCFGNTLRCLAVSQEHQGEGLLNEILSHLIEVQMARGNSHLFLYTNGSCFGNTLRCLAVSQEHQGEGLLNEILSHLIEVQMARGNSHLFLYTKPSSAKFMESLGFREIARVSDKAVFMENRRNGFSQYCQQLAAQKRDGSAIAGIVMNANPFTLGHLHLVEQAARENDVVHLFVLSEQAGPIPFAVRKKLVLEGIGHLKNVICHDSGPYIISSATFPSYFLKDGDAVIETQAALDLQVFGKIAAVKNVICHDSGPYIISSATFPSYFLKDGDAVIETQAALDLQVFGKIAAVLGIQRRYVGQEKSSHVTALYNAVMKQNLPKLGIQCVEIPRLQAGGQVVSASTVRQAIHDGQLETVRNFLPQSTYAYFAGPEGAAVTAAIRAEKNVIRLFCRPGGSGSYSGHPGRKECNPLLGGSADGGHLGTNAASSGNACVSPAIPDWPVCHAHCQLQYEYSGTCEGQCLHSPGIF